MTKPTEMTQAKLQCDIVRWSLLVVFVVVLFAPAALFGDDRYWLPLFSKYMALALFAMSVDLIWGYTGLMSLGQGLYFGLGAYALGYSLILQKAAQEAGVPAVAGPNMAIPDFMRYCRVEAVPAWIGPLIDLRLAMTLAIVLPVLVAFAFGAITFRLRIKGVYFSLVTQALVLAVFTLIVNQQSYTGGVVGMRDIAKLELFGHKFQMLGLYYLTTGILVICFLACLVLMRSKFGRVVTAIRDNENRVLALGYNTAMYKTFVFSLAAGLSALAGMLYVASQGTAGPDRFGIEFSIEVVIMVAVGGRGTLFGAVIGAVLVNLGATYINNEFENAWRFMLGALFIGIVVFLPNGIVGGFFSLQQWLASKWKARPVTDTLPPMPTPGPSVAATEFTAKTPAMQSPPSTQGV